MTMSRRFLLAAGLAAPFAAPATALAALKMPLKEPPPYVRPLGQWSIQTRKLEVVQDGTAPVDVVAPLQFRPVIDVATPVLRWWWQAPGCGRAHQPCITKVDPTTLDPPILSLPTSVFTDVPITITVPTQAKPVPPPRGLSPLYPNVVLTAGYRVTIEMSDPDTNRRASFSFVLTILNRSRD
jgi:hypothetical protein